MSGDEPHRDKRVRFTRASDERFGKWAEDASAEDFDLAGRVLLSVTDGTWRDTCECHPDVFHPFIWHIVIRRGLILSLKFAQEYPDYVQLIYIGEP